MIIKRKLTLLFNWESLLLLPILYFLCFTVVAAYDYLSTKKDFTKHTGQIISFKKVEAINQKDRLRYGRDHSLILKINTEPNKIFRIAVGSNSYYERSLLVKLKLNDSITIFTSPTILDTKGPYIIEKLAKQKEIIIPFSNTINKMVSKKFLLISFSIFLVLSIIYYLLLRRRYFRFNDRD